MAKATRFAQEYLVDHPRIKQFWCQILPWPASEYCDCGGILYGNSKKPYVSPKMFNLQNRLI